MGLASTSVKLLLNTKQQFGIDFSRTMMIGRQELKLSGDWLNKHLKESQLSHLNAEEILGEVEGYAEPFLRRALGAEETSSIDASDYEGAAHVFDMSRPIPDVLKKRFSVVLDGGSLEHIFNVPVAIQNCMEMVEVGGHYIGILPCNNYFGHGLYQFSPEFFYRVFSPENGFEAVKMWIYAPLPEAKIYEVQDPLAVRHRVTMNNRYPTDLFFIAKRVADVPLFTKQPLQSDYEFTVWTGDVSHKYRDGNRAKAFVSSLPDWIKFPLKSVVKAIKSLPDLWKIIFRQAGKSDPRFIKQERVF